ncbi:MAG: hypothetical protein WCO96_04675 [Actinomycetes bacterium]
MTAPAHRGRWTPLRRTLTLDAVALACLAAGMVLILTLREDQPKPEGGFVAGMPASLLMLAAAILPVVAAGIAAVSLWRDRLRSREGIWAIRLTIAAAFFLPILGVIQGLAELAGHRLPEGWGQPLVPIWFVTMGAVAVLAIRAPDPGRRAVLAIPLVFGAAVLAFVFGDVIAG